MQPLQYDLRCPAAKDNRIRPQATSRSHYNAICRDGVTTLNGIRNCSSKTSRRQSKKKDDFEALFKRNYKGKSPAPKLRKSGDKSLSQPSCSHTNTIYDVQLQKTIVLRTQVRRQATLTHHRTMRNGVGNCSSKSRSRRQFKMWKRRFLARLPSKSESGRFENEAFVRDVPQRLPSNSDSWRCEKEAFARDILKKVMKMWKRSFRVRHPSISDSWRCENEAFLRDIPQKVMKMWKRRFLARLPSKPESLRCENELSCETSLKIWKWKKRKRSFRARRPSKSERWRCENEAFEQDVPPNLNVEDVKTKLSCETSVKIWKWKMWKRSFCAPSLRNWKCKMWKRSFRARRPSKSERWRCENKAFVRDFRQNLKVEDVCETSLRNWKWKMWKRSFCARHPSKSDEDVKTKLSCETSFKIWKWKMWKRRFLARRPSIFESWSCENDAWAVSSTAGPIRRQNLQVEDAKTKFSCETSLKI